MYGSGLYVHIMILDRSFVGFNSSQVILSEFSSRYISHDWLRRNALSLIKITIFT